MSLTQRTAAQKNCDITRVLKDKPKIGSKINTALPGKKTTEGSVLQQSKPKNAVVLPKSSLFLKPTNIVKKSSEVSAGTTAKTTALSKLSTNTRTTIVTSQELLQENVSHSTKLIDAIINVDEGDEKDPCLVSEYILDIYNYLKTLEVKLKIKENYLMGHQTSARNRSILVNWMVGICANFKFLPETFHLSVGILDRYLQSNKTVGSKTLQLVGVTAMVIASKYEEVYIPNIRDFIFITDDSVTANDIFKTEIDILKTLEFDLGKPLSLHFLRRFSKVSSPDITTYNLAKYFLDIFLLDYNVCSILPSLQAAAALCLALYIFNDKTHIRLCWTKTLEHYSGYKYDNFNIFIMKLVVAYFKMEKSRFDAVKKKYADSKLGSISNHTTLQTSMALKSLYETALKIVQH